MHWLMLARIYSKFMQLTLIIPQLNFAVNLCYTCAAALSAEAPKWCRLTLASAVRPGHTLSHTDAWASF